MVQLLLGSRAVRLGRPVEPDGAVDRLGAAAADPAPRHRRPPARRRRSSNNYSMTEAGTGFTYLPREELERVPDRSASRWAPRSASATPTATRSRPARSARCSSRSGTKHREYYRDPEATAATWTRRVAALRRPRLPRRRRLPLHLGPDEGHDHPGRQQHPRDRRRSGAVRAPGRSPRRPSSRCPTTCWARTSAPAVVARAGLRAHGRGRDRVLRERLADYKVPRVVTFVDELPRNPTGKVLKHQLTT